MKRLLILTLLSGLMTACASNPDNVMNNASASCEIINNEKTPGCYISSSKPGCLDISNTKTACKRGESCDIPSYNVTTTYNDHGSTCVRKPSTKSATQ